MAKLIYRGKVYQGKILFDDRQLVNDRVKTLENYFVEVTIEPESHKVKWNNYYWAVPIAIVSQHTGSSPLEVHKEFKKSYLYQIIQVDKDDNPYSLNTTTKLTPENWERYVNLIKFDLEHQGYKIPLPGEVDYE